MHALMVQLLSLSPSSGLSQCQSIHHGPINRHYHACALHTRTASQAVLWSAKAGMASTEASGVARCEHVTVKFQQRDLETANDWDTLTPGNTAEYAWDEPMAAHRLRVVLESATEAFRDAPVQEYNLDDIKVDKPYTLCEAMTVSGVNPHIAYMLLNC